MMLTFPTTVPSPLRPGYGFEPENNISRTPLQSGRARQRTNYTFVPSYATTQWLLTSIEAVDFESFTAEVGGDWFEIPLLTPNGSETRICRFMETPSGPRLEGVEQWRYTAKLELQTRATTIEASS